MGIFGKPPESKPVESKPEPPRSAPAAGAPAASPTVCTIGPKTMIRGEITGDEDVLVQGTVEGQVRISRELRVAPGGAVKATVSARAIVVSGEVNGDCHAEGRVEIQATGRLTGNVRSPKIVIAEGAVFKGNSDMSAGKEERIPGRIVAS